jgi:hypothetical protein
MFQLIIPIGVLIGLKRLTAVLHPWRVEHGTLTLEPLTTFCFGEQPPPHTCCPDEGSAQECEKCS